MGCNAVTAAAPADAGRHRLLGRPGAARAGPLRGGLNNMGRLERLNSLRDLRGGRE